MKNKTVRKIIFHSIRCGWLVLVPLKAALAQPANVAAGEQVFQNYCAACHSIGEGRRVGPDLIAIHEKRSQAWLEGFVKSAKSLFDSGDTDAVAVFAEYSPMVMPDSAISDQQIREVLLYIQSRSPGAVSASNPSSPAPVASPGTVPAVAATPPSALDIERGARLFQGRSRFENSGPACNACHAMANSTVSAGGSLAVDLSSVHSRMSAAGISAILSAMPFPAMQVAYQDRPLTAGEVEALTAFFQDAEAGGGAGQTVSSGLGLALSGFLGAGLLFGLFPYVWRKRKIGSVNQSIYDRQDKTG